LNVNRLKLTAQSKSCAVNAIFDTGNELVDTKNRPDIKKRRELDTLGVFI